MLIDTLPDLSCITPGMNKQEIMLAICTELEKLEEIWRTKLHAYTPYGLNVAGESSFRRWILPKFTRAAAEAEEGSESNTLVDKVSNFDTNVTNNSEVTEENVADTHFNDLDIPHLTATDGILPSTEMDEFLFSTAVNVEPEIENVPSNALPGEDNTIVPELSETPSIDDTQDQSQLYDAASLGPHCRRSQRTKKKNKSYYDCIWEN